MTTTLGQRLKSSRLKVGLNQKQVAEAVGIKQPTYQALEAGKTKKTAFIAELASVLSVDVYWLANGVNSSDIDEAVSHILDNSATPLLNNAKNIENRICLDVVEVAFEKNMEQEIETEFNETGKKVGFDQEFFSKYSVEIQNIKLITATDDSQSPYVKAGDIFAIDISSTNIKDGDFYAVYFEGELMLMQIFKEENSRLTLHSLNTKHRDRTVHMNNYESFKVIGKQFWRAG